MTSKSPTTDLGDWVDALLAQIFFQPDDTAAAAAYEKDVHPDFQLTFNGKPISRAEYYGLIVGGRARNDMSAESSVELLCKIADEDGHAGSVAHHSVITLKDKKTGVTVRHDSVTLATVVWENGRRHLSLLHEVADF